MGIFDPGLQSVTEWQTIHQLVMSAVYLRSQPGNGVAISRHSRYAFRVQAT